MAKINQIFETYKAERIHYKKTARIIFRHIFTKAQKTVKANVPNVTQRFAWLMLNFTIKSARIYLSKFQIITETESLMIG